MQLEPAVVETTTGAAGDFFPAPSVRLYRSRPQPAGSSPTAGKTEILASETKGVGLAAAIPASPTPSTDFAPVLVDRLYKGRPKTGVPGATHSWSTVEPVAEPLVSSPAVLSIGVADCAPGLVARLARLRPKAGVDSSAVILGYSAAGAVDFPSTTPDFNPDWWDVLRRQADVHEPHVPDALQTACPGSESTLAQDIRTKHFLVPDPEPVLATLPKPESSAAPSFLDRLYRMRPKSGKASGGWRRMSSHATRRATIELGDAGYSFSNRSPADGRRCR